MKRAFEKVVTRTVKAQRETRGRSFCDAGLAGARPSKSGKVIADLRTQLDNMGPVNLEAVHEYDELEERYKFLEAQNTDLTNSQRELLDVIARINSTTQETICRNL